jgi:hypothetical protein
MNIEFKEPWIAVGEFASNLARELEHEVTENHPLWNKKARALAQRTDSDDVLFALEHEESTPRYAVVHLTWSGEPELDPRWPDTQCYNSLEEWVRDRMMPDHAEFTDG